MKYLTAASSYDLGASVSARGAITRAARKRACGRGLEGDEALDVAPAPTTPPATTVAAATAARGAGVGGTVGRVNVRKLRHQVVDEPVLKSVARDVKKRV